MVRLGERGPYAPGNVYVATFTGNARSARPKLVLFDFGFLDNDKKAPHSSDAPATPPPAEPAVSPNSGRPPGGLFISAGDSPDI